MSDDFKKIFFYANAIDCDFLANNMSSEEVANHKKELADWVKLNMPNIIWLMRFKDGNICPYVIYHANYRRCLVARWRQENA